MLQLTFYHVYREHYTTLSNVKHFQMLHLNLSKLSGTFYVYYLQKLQKNKNCGTIKIQNAEY